MSRLKKILMTRDGLTAEEAEELIEAARAETLAYFSREYNARDPETILEEDFGLEPDFVQELF